MPQDNYDLKPKKKKRRKKHYFLRFLIFAALTAGLVSVLRSELFNVRAFDIQGNNYYTAAQIQEMTGLSTGVNMFRQKLSAAKEALLEDPYIKTASLKRVPMHTIRVEIEERREYACVPYGSEFVLIDDEGMVLRISEEQAVLPLLDGMSINEMTPGKALGVEQSYLLTNTLELLKLMYENDLYFKKILFSNVIVKAYIYDDLYCEGTPENITNQMGAVKRLVEEQYKQGIVRGVIKVGKDNYIAFSPKLQ